MDIHDPGNLFGSMEKSLAKISDEPQRFLFYMAQHSLPDDHVYSENKKFIFSIKIRLNYEVEYLPSHLLMNLKSSSLSLSLDSSFLLDDAKVHDTMRRILFLNMSVPDQALDSIVKAVSGRANSIKNNPRNARRQGFSFNLPAAKDAVRGLEKLEFNKGCCLGQDRCPICLKEFDVGEENVTRLLCLHVYHGDCIHRWLIEGNSCPSCRCPLPVFGTENPPRRVVEEIFSFLKFSCSPPVARTSESGGGEEDSTGK